MAQEKPRSTIQRRAEDRSGRRSMVAYVVRGRITIWLLTVTDAIDVAAGKHDVLGIHLYHAQHVKKPAKSVFIPKQRNESRFQRGEQIGDEMDNTDVLVICVIFNHRRE